MSVLKNRNFVNLWLSVCLAQSGSFFTMVALPWLVLANTGDNAWYMTTVMACWGLPHSVFIVFGGALCDMWSPHKTLLVSRLMFVVMLMVFAAFVYYGLTPMGLIYGFAFVLGTLGAMGLAANQALLASIVAKDQLAQANSLTIGAMQLTQILGPLLAGWLILAIRHYRNTPIDGLDGVALSVAFLVDALLVFIAVIFLRKIRLRRQTPVKPVGELLFMVKDGLDYCWSDRSLRTILLYLLLISFLLFGPLQALMPLLAKTSLGLNEAGLGSLYAMLGLGTIGGAALAAFKTPNPNQLGMTVLLCDMTSGLCFVLLGYAQSLYIAGAVLVVIGGCSGLVMVVGNTWFAQRTPANYLGRVMSLLMFTILGLAPLSAVLVGYWVEDLTLQGVTTLCGLLVAGVCVTGLAFPGIRRLDMSPDVAIEKG